MQVLAIKIVHRIVRISVIIEFLKLTNLTFISLVIFKSYKSIKSMKSINRKTINKFYQQIKKIKAQSFRIQTLQIWSKLKIRRKKFVKSFDELDFE